MFLIIPFLIPLLIGGLITVGLAKFIVEHLNKKEAKKILSNVINPEEYKEAKENPIDIGLAKEKKSDFEEVLYSNKEKIDPIKIWYNKKGEIVDSVQIEYKTIDENLAKELKKNEIVIL